MRRAKKRQFREPTPMDFFPIRFVMENLITVRATPNDVTKYDGPLISGEIGMIDGFRIIETVLR